MARRPHASKRAAEPEVVTIKEAAALLGVAEITLRRWDETGKFKARRHINGYRLYRVADLAQLKGEIEGPR